MLIRRFLLSLALCGTLVAAFAVSTASAATPANSLGAPAGVAQELTPWFPSPTSKNLDFYRADIAPLSDPNAPEITDFSCNYPASNYSGQPMSTPGHPITAGTLAELKKIFTKARETYDTAIEKKGLTMSLFLKSQTTGADAAAPPVRDLITVTTNPALLTSSVPFGCDAGELSNFPEADLGFGKLISDTDQWITNLVLWIPGETTLFAYNLVESRAFAYAFWTPHSERGDLMFSGSQFACKGASTNSDWCTASGQARGFSKSALTAKEVPKWVQLSIFFQWLLGATYFVLLAAMALIYMSRANHRSTFTIVTMVPRLLFSIGLTVTAMFLMGGMITFSNYLVQALFGLGDSGSIRGVREVFFSIGDITGTGTSTIGTGFLQIGLMAIATVYLAKFLIFALFRQLVLVILIAVAPLACFCLIHPKMKEHFFRYLRAFGAILAAPVIMALILKIGLSLNPAINNVESGNSDITENITGSLFGALMLLVTFFFMAKVPKLTVAAVRNRGVSEGMGGKLGKSASKIGQIVMPANPAIGAALMAGGALSQAGSRGSARITGGMAKLIPDQKVRGAVSGPAQPGVLSRLAATQTVGDAQSRGMGRLLNPAMSEDGAKGLGGTLKLAAGAAVATGLASALPNPKMEGELAKWKSIQNARLGLREISNRVASKLLADESLALKRARDGWNEKQMGKEFDEQEWLDTVYRAPKMQVTSSVQNVLDAKGEYVIGPDGQRRTRLVDVAGQGNARAIQKRVGATRKWYASYEPEARTGAPAGPGTPPPPAPPLPPTSPPGAPRPVPPVSVPAAAHQQARPAPPARTQPAQPPVSPPVSAANVRADIEQPTNWSGPPVDRPRS